MSSGSRKPLIRSNSYSDRPTTMRNWPLFVFLICLVLFFYAFYVYQAQGAILAQTNEEVRQLATKLSLTNGKLVGSMAELETMNTETKTLKNQLLDVTNKNDDCMGSLRNTKLRVDLLEKDGKTNMDNYSKMQEELAALKSKSDELERNNTAMTSLLSAQTQLIAQLNQTIGIIQLEKEELKNAATLNNLKAKAEEKLEEKTVDPKAQEPKAQEPKVEEPKGLEQQNEKEVALPTPSIANVQNQGQEAAANYVQELSTGTVTSTQYPIGKLDERNPEEPEQVVAQPGAREEEQEIDEKEA